MQLPQQLTPMQKITKSKIRLLSESPFFGYLVLNLNIKEDNNMPMPTACVDAFGNMFFDSNFINKLDLDECKTVVCHEVLHCLTPDMIVGTKDLNISEISDNDMVIDNNGKECKVLGMSERIYKGRRRKPAGGCFKM
ncbi:MAG: hypothetical protein AABW67_03455, partial [Nanoarchaeota archaeon]